MRLRGKVALVTGGASGLGKASAHALADSGAHVVVADVDADGAAAVADAVGGAAIATDVRTLEDNERAVAFARERFGGFDLVLLNAGLMTGCGVEDFDSERYRRAVAVNLDGVVYGTHAALPALREGGGAIVAMASIAGLAAQALDPVYVATKHAVVGFVRSMGLALGGTGVRMNAVCPAYAETPLLDALREQIARDGADVLPTETVAATVLRLFSGDENGECWYVQPGRPAEAFRFRRVPGPRPVATS